MKTLLKILVLTLFVQVWAFAQNFTTVTASLIQDASGALLASGQLCASGVAANGTIINYQAGGGGIVTRSPVCTNVLNGAIAGYKLANSSLTYPTNVAYVLTVTDNTSGAVIMRVGPTQISGSIWSLDAYQPNLAPLALVQAGPAGPAGAAATVTSNGANGDFTVLGALRSKTGPVYDVTAWGASGGGVSYDQSYLTSAINAAGTSTVFLPKGTYLLDNSAGPISFSGFNGSVEGVGPGSALVCASLANNCLVFANSTGLSLKNFSIYFQTAAGTCNPETTNCTTSRNGSQALVVNTSSAVTLDSLYIHDGPSSAVNFNSVSSGVIRGMRLSRLWANGLFLVNSSKINISDTRTYALQDAALELSQYDGQTGTCQDVTSTGFVSTDDFGLLLVNSCQNVAFSDFIVRDTYVGAVSIIQDAATTTTRWPDQVVISNGVIKAAGSHNPSNSAVQAISMGAAGTTPTNPIHITVSNVRIDGGNAGANAFVTAQQAQLIADLHHVSITNGMNSCFDLSGGQVFAEDLKCDHSGGNGLVIRTTKNFVGKNIHLWDCGTGANVPALQNTSAGTVIIRGLFSGSDLSPSRANVYDSATSGVHLFEDVDLLTADGTTPTFTYAGSGSTVLYDGTANGSRLRSPQTPFQAVLAQSDYDSSNGSSLPQIVIKGKTNANNVLTIGFDTVLNMSLLQSSTIGTANRPLVLNPNNGVVMIGTKTLNGSNSLQVAGSALFSGTAQLLGIKATTGNATVCIDTSGNLVKSASACTGN